MNRAVCIFYLLLMLSTGASNCYSQGNDAELRKLDSLAFASLENNDSETTKRANNLLEESEKQKALLYKINALTILGIVNKEKGYYVTALNHYLEALNTAEKIDDNPRVSACYNNIGQIYQLQENYVKANEYYHTSLEIGGNLLSPLQKSIRLYNIGEVFNEMDSLELALTYFNNSLLIEKKAQNKEGIIYALLGVSEVYLKIKRFTDAEITLVEIKSLLNEYFLEETIIYNITSGQLSYSKEDKPKAIEKYKVAEKLSVKNEFRIYLPKIYGLIIEVLESEGKWEECAKYYSLKSDLAQKLNDTKVKNQLEDLTFQNELNKKTLEIEFIQEERDIANNNARLHEEISAYSTKITGFLILSILLMIAAIIFGLNYLNKK